MTAIMQKQNFIGMDTDTEPRFTSSGTYRYALNCRVGSTSDGNIGAVENVKGNTLVSIDLPSGTNKVIGSVEDRPTNSCFYLLYNSNSDHGIYRYFSDTNTIEKIFEWSGLNFHENEIIGGIGFENNTLFWAGPDNPPRALDINNIANFDPVYTEEYISLIKRPPNLPPTIGTVGIDATRGVNYIQDKQFQFRTQFIFMDNSVSTLSPISEVGYGNPTYSSDLQNKIPVIYSNLRSGPTYFNYNVGSYNEFPSTDNYINVILNINDLLSSEFGKMVKKVNVMYREGNTGKFGTFKTLTRAEALALINDTVIFYNDTAVNIVSDKDDAKLFDSVPLKSSSLALMKNRVFLGDNTEGYAKPAPIEFTVTQTLSTFTPSLLGTQVFKNRGQYSLGVVFYDQYMRSSGVLQSTPDATGLSASNVYVNAGKIMSFVNNGSFTQTNCTALNVTLPNNYTVPEWAYYYSIVRTKNTSFNFFERLMVSKIKYLVGYDGDGNPLYVDYNNTTSKEVHIFVDSGTPSNVFYNFVEGDLLYMEFQDVTGGPLQTATLPVRGLVYSDDKLGTSLKVISGNVRGQALTTNEIINQQSGLSALIVSMEDFTKAGLSGVNAKQIWGAEVFSPTVNDGIYYEVGDILPINNPGESNRQFSSLAISITGDVYQTMRNFYVKPVGAANSFITKIPCESYSLYNRNYEVNNSDIGRSNVVIDDERQIEEHGAVRFGNQFIQDSDINGLSSFDSADKDTLTNDYGNLNKLIVASNNQSEGNVLLAVFKNAIASIYIGDALIRDAAGTELLSGTTNVIGGWRILRGEWGTSHPSSVVQEDSAVYGFDVSKGIVWRYAQDGLTAISEYKRKYYFFNKSRELLSSDISIVIGCYDRFHDEYVLTFKTDDSEETVAFSETILNMRGNPWTTYYSYIPEWMEKVNTRFVTFKDGSLWLHDSNSIYNNFYDAQYNSQITGICNLDPSKQKILLNVTTESVDKWIAIQITTPEGQETNLQDSDYRLVANAWSANVLRDINTPNVTYPILQGDMIRSSIFLIKMENTKTTLSPLYFANYKVIGSERSNR